jgi:hypothetical protein
LETIQLSGDNNTSVGQHGMGIRSLQHLTRVLEETVNMEFPPALVKKPGFIRLEGLAKQTSSSASRSRSLRLPIDVGCFPFHHFHRRLGITFALITASISILV